MAWRHPAPPTAHLGPEHYPDTTTNHSATATDPSSNARLQLTVDQPAATGCEEQRLRAYAAMHRDAGRHYSKKHRNITLFVMVVALVSALITHVVQATDPVRAAYISNMVVTFNAGLTAINNFLGYQARGARHMRAGNDFREAADGYSDADAAESATRFAELCQKSGDLPQWAVKLHSNTVA